MQQNTIFSPQQVLQQSCWYRTATLAERLAGIALPPPSPEQQQVVSQQTDTIDHNKAQRRLKRWKEMTPFQKQECFAERLSTQALTEKMLLQLLDESETSLQERLRSLPWIQEFAQALANFTGDVSVNLSLSQSKSGNAETAKYSLLQLQPFAPFIERGRERLKSGLQKLYLKYHCIPFDAKNAEKFFLPSLYTRILQVTQRVLALELQVANLEKQLSGDTPQQRFKNFIEQMSTQEKLLALLQEYTPLARIVTTLMDHWVSFSLEILTHLCQDWDELLATFTPGTDPGQLIEIHTGMGDAHRRGRSTVKLRFASGWQILYKPKSLQIDAHFQQLLHWLNQHDANPPFRTLTILPRSSYGWVEYVQTAPCSTDAELTRFYQRQGALLALLYALEATDMHSENVLASGEHPMVIDLETLFQPHVALDSPSRLASLSNALMGSSVVRSGLLPQRLWGNSDASGVDISGLSHVGGQMTPMPVLQIEEEGTDTMHYVRRRIRMPDSQNYPIPPEHHSTVLHYISPLIAGFQKMYRLLIRHREELLVGPLQTFYGDEIRLVVRSTQNYGELLQESYHPDLLRDSLDRDRFFDHLWTATERIPTLKQLLAAEIADLHLGDVPLFTTTTSSRDVYTTHSQCIAQYLPESSFDSVTKRITQMDEHDLERQSWFIQASFTTLVIGTEHVGMRPSVLEPVLRPATSQRLLMAAQQVGNRLSDLAFSAEGMAGWIGLSPGKAREWNLAPAGFDLYSGLSGIVFFLAYLGTITADQRYTQLARQALLTIHKQLPEWRPYLRSIGAFSGWGGLIYTYTHMGVLWKESSFLDEAESFVERIAELVIEDTTLDLIGGSAGAILCLLNLYSIRPKESILKVAQTCGEHLLKNAPQCAREGYVHLDPLHQQPLTGLSHGAAGIAFALCRLAEVSGESHWLVGVHAALAYERNLFLPGDQNWPDLREAEPDYPQAVKGPSCMTTWCHGAPGIGLSRLLMSRKLDDEQLQEEIRIALDTTLRNGFGLNHSLCHGDMGNLDILLTASHILKEPQYQESVERLTAEILQSIERHGCITGIALGIESPDLMCGIAGIGHGLLRLAFPDRVPSPLSLQAPYWP